MVEIRRTNIFDAWLRALRDRRARAKIEQRLDRLQEGNAGDMKAVGHGILELRIDYGPGYRVYFTRRGRILTVILCGGDKSTQARDIERAQEIAANLPEV